MGSILRRPIAEADLRDIWMYIAEDDAVAADRMLDRIAEALAMLAENPEAGRDRSDIAAGIRSFPVGRYVLFHRAVTDGVELVRVLHGERDIDGDIMDGAA